MNGNKKIAGQFVQSATISEVLVSCGIQLIHWANDIAFTDAPFGEEWSLETANRMASLSEILNVVYKRLPLKTLSIVVDFPDGMVGQVQINQDYKPEAEEPKSDDLGSSGKYGGVQNSIDDFPF
jgi:hypothetical protein